MKLHFEEEDLSERQECSAQFGRVLGEDRSGKQYKEQQEGAQRQQQSTVGYR